MKQLPPFSFLLFLTLLFSLSLQISSQNSTHSPSQSSACKSTLYPKLCRSILSAIKSSPLDPYAFGKFSIKQCLKYAYKSSDMIHKYVHRQRRSMSDREAGAIEDCLQLFQLNVDFLDTISGELQLAAAMSDELVDRVRARLSAIVTNQMTCFDGFVEAKSGVLGEQLSAPVFDTGKLYSVSLGLVSHALAKNLKRHKRQNNGSVHEKGGFPAHQREPLASFIKALQKRYTCNRESSNGCPNRRERMVSEMEGNGILVNDSVVVSKDGSGNFTTIGEAISAAPNNSKPQDGYFVIYATKGDYQEYIVIPRFKTNIMLLGDGINATVVSGNHSVVDGWSTFNSSTFAVSGDRFVAIDITFRNSAGPEKHQAVAVRNNADLSSFFRCSFEGYQDTLYVHSLRQFYRDCDIYGTVDFIFGNAAAVFQNCNLYARKPMLQQKNAFTAQGRTDPNQNTGISIHNCTVEAAPDLAADPNSTLSFLGRPWKPYSRTVYMQSYIGSVINPVGWLEWNGTVGLDTIYYGEFENYGPGSGTGTRVDWPGFSLMNATEALNFTVYNFTKGYSWLPDTDIPYSEGLLVE